MPETPQDDANRAESVRLHGLLARLVRLPLPILLLGFRWVRRLFATPKSPAQLRSAEKNRQAGIRRELRGLPAAHDRQSPDEGDGNAP